MKSLKHNGIRVPRYELKNLQVKIKEERISLGIETEQMALAFARRVLSENPIDNLFFSNFVRDFKNYLIKEKGYPKEKLDDWYLTLISKLESKKWIEFYGKNKELDFTEIERYILEEKERKENMSKKEKKTLREERKRLREELKRKYGYAIVDGNKVEIMNWTAEPSCIFVGRGEHPKRGSWKEGPKEEDIILNLSPDAEIPPGKWKAVIWEPNKLYVAKWKDKLSGKIKYVWFSENSYIRQEREKEKFKKARLLDKKIEHIRKHIETNLTAKDPERRKIASVCYLIFQLNMRVGDEKDKDEVNTVGAITLRPEHITFRDRIIIFDFLGKDAVHWHKELKACKEFRRNLEEFISGCKEHIFEGITSRKVSSFLSEVFPNLTAKVFRTWKCTKTVEEFLEKTPCSREDPDYYKKYVAKMANLQGAKVCNHKRKIPKNWEKVLEKKVLKRKELEGELKRIIKQGKKTDRILRKLEKLDLEIKLRKEIKEYTLGTSLKSYIDPSIFIRWAKEVDFSLKKLYPKSLRKKFSFCIPEEEIE